MMNPADLIYQEAKSCPTIFTLLEAFFAPYQRSLSNFRFNRDEANER